MHELRRSGDEVRARARLRFSFPAPPAPPEGSRPRLWTITELYYLFAREEELDGEHKVECTPCRKRTPCRKQLRLAHQPNVLFVLVKRGGPDGFSRHQVVPEKELSFTGSVMAAPFG